MLASERRALLDELDVAEVGGDAFVPADIVWGEVDGDSHEIASDDFGSLRKGL